MKLINIFKNTIMKKNNNITLLTKLEGLLKSHDWTYQYSDDNRWYEAGRASASRIQELMEECANQDLGTMARTLYDKHNPFNQEQNV